MADLFVPPTVSRELREETLRREAEGLRDLSVDRGWRWVKEFEQELQRIDPLLFGPVKCPDPAPIDAVVMGARPGFWHVGRGNPTAPQSLLPITGPHGEYVEPSSGVFDMLRASDLWNDEVRRDQRRREQQLADAKQRREERERREFDEECLERWNAVSRTQVSMSRDRPWAQNSQGLKRGGVSRRQDG